MGISENLNAAGLHTQIYGNKQVIVDGCQSVLDYTDDSVSLKCGRLKVCIKGTEIKIRILSDTQAVVEGIIQAVNYEYL